MKVLIVDDSISVRKVIERALNALGVKKTFEAKDGKEGLKILSENPDISIAFIDWEMPVMDGLELVKTIRAEKLFSDLKIIMASSKQSKNDIITALKSGADNYIAKPFSDKTLTAQIKPVIHSLKPTQNTAEFIRYFSKKVIKNVIIVDEMMQLDFGDKKINIDIPMMIYHGAMHIEDTRGGSEEEFVFLNEH